MVHNELNYNNFQSSNKIPIHLQPVLGSMIALSSALSNDYNADPSYFVPKNKKINQHNHVLETSASSSVNIKLPFLTNVYIGSLTIVGLFIIFRFVQKHP